MKKATLKARTCFSLLFTLLSIGCSSITPSHVHNPGYAETSSKLINEWEIYDENQGVMYQSMRDNLDAFAAQEEDLVNALSENAFRTHIESLVDINGKQLAQKHTELSDQTVRFRKELDKRISAFMAQNKISIDGRDSAKAKILGIQAEIKELKLKIDAYERLIAFLHKSVADLSSDSTASSLNSIDILKSFADSEIGDSADANEYVKSVNAAWALLRTVPEAPGIGLLIWNTTLQIAQIELRKHEAQLKRYRARQILFEDTVASLEIAEILIEENQKSIVDQNAPALFTVVKAGGRVDLDDQTSLTVKLVQFINSDDADDQLFVNLIKTRNSLLILRRHAIAQWLIEANISALPLKLARLDHYDSIHNSQFNDEIWVTMLRSSSEAVAEFHKGGFKSEDLDTILNAVRDVVLGVIAIRIN